MHAYFCGPFISALYSLVGTHTLESGLWPWLKQCEDIALIFSVYSPQSIHTKRMQVDKHRLGNEGSLGNSTYVHVQCSTLGMGLGVAVGVCLC